MAHLIFSVSFSIKTFLLLSKIKVLIICVISEHYRSLKIELLNQSDAPCKEVFVSNEPAFKNSSDKTFGLMRQTLAYVVLTLIALHIARILFLMIAQNLFFTWLSVLYKLIHTFHRNEQLSISNDCHAGCACIAAFDPNLMSISSY